MFDLSKGLKMWTGWSFVNNDQVLPVFFLSLISYVLIRELELFSLQERIHLLLSLLLHRHNLCKLILHQCEPLVIKLNHPSLQLHLNFLLWGTLLCFHIFLECTLVVYIFIVKDFSFVFHFNDLPFLIVFCSSWVWMGYSNKLGHQNI